MRDYYLHRKKLSVRRNNNRILDIMTRQCNAPQRSGGVSILVCCLLATIQCITAAMAAAITRDLTSESNVISADILEFHLRSDLKIKQTCPDLNYILAPLHNADADGNGVLNQEEFVVFADVVSGGYLTETNRAGSFSEIPLALQNAYLVLSCSCEFFQSEPWGGKGCCTVSGNGLNDLNGIRTNGTAPGETLTTNERRYLTNVCGTMTETLDSIGAGLVSPPPTGRPTIPPTTMVSVCLGRTQVKLLCQESYACLVITFLEFNCFAHSSVIVYIDSLSPVPDFKEADKSTE